MCQLLCQAYEVYWGGAVDDANAGFRDSPGPHAKTGNIASRAPFLGRVGLNQPENNIMFSQQRGGVALHTYNPESTTESDHSIESEHEVLNTEKGALEIGRPQVVAPSSYIEKFLDAESDGRGASLPGPADLFSDHLDREEWHEEHKLGPGTLYIPLDNGDPTEPRSNKKGKKKEKEAARLNSPQPSVAASHSSQKSGRKEKGKSKRNEAPPQSRKPKGGARRGNSALVASLSAGLQQLQGEKDALRESLKEERETAKASCQPGKAEEKDNPNSGERGQDGSGEAGAIPDNSILQATITGNKVKCLNWRSEYYWNECPTIRQVAMRMGSITGAIAGATYTLYKMAALRAEHWDLRLRLATVPYITAAPIDAPQTMIGRFLSHLCRSTNEGRLVAPEMRDYDEMLKAARSRFCTKSDCSFAIGGPPKFLGDSPNPLKKRNFWTKVGWVALGVGTLIGLGYLAYEAWTIHHRALAYEFEMEGEIAPPQSDRRPDPNSLQKLKHQTMMMRGTLHKFSAFGHMCSCQRPYVIDLELFSQLSAAAILMTDKADMRKAVEGAARRYHQVNTDRYAHYYTGQDVVANTARLVSSIQYHRRCVLENEVFRE